MIVRQPAGWSLTVHFYDAQPKAPCTTCFHLQVIKNMQTPMHGGGGPQASFGNMPANNYGIMQQPAPVYGMSQPSYTGF